MFTSGVSDKNVCVCVCCAVVRREIINNNCHFWHPPFGAIFALKGRFCCQPWPFLWWESMRSFEKLRLIISLRLVSVICSGRHCFHHCLTETGWGSQSSTRDVVENQKKKSPASVGWFFINWVGLPGSRGPGLRCPFPGCCSNEKVLVSANVVYLGYLAEQVPLTIRRRAFASKSPMIWRKTRRFLGWKRRYLLPEGGSTQQKENGINLGVGKCYIFTPLH